MPTITAHRARPSVRLGPSFSLFWFGEGVSLLGTATTSVLLPLLAVIELQAGPVWMGMLTAASWLPWLVLGLPAGAWLDRSDPRRVMIIADLVAAGTLVSVPVAWALDGLSLVQLLGVAFVGGTCTVFFRTGYVKLLPLIVPDAGLETANARVFGTESAMQIAGPGVAGLVAQLASAATGVIGSVVGFVVSALCLERLRVPAQSRPAAPVDRLRTRIAEGVQTVLKDQNLRVLMIIGGVSNLGLTGYAALLVLFLVGDLGLPEVQLGMVMMCGGVGGLLGALVAPWLGRRLGTGRASTALLLVAGPAALLVGAPTSANQAYLTAAGLFLVGAAVVGGNVIRGAWRQRYVPAELMGRVMTTMQVVNYGTMPLAGLAAAVLGSRWGVQPAIMTLAAVHALGCLSILGTRLGRLAVLPTWGPDRSPGVGVADRGAE
jgi:MFS family permease